MAQAIPRFGHLSWPGPVGDGVDARAAAGGHGCAPRLHQRLPEVISGWVPGDKDHAGLAARGPAWRKQLSTSALSGLMGGAEDRSVGGDPGSFSLQGSPFDAGPRWGGDPAPPHSAAPDRPLHAALEHRSSAIFHPNPEPPFTLILPSTCVRIPSSLAFARGSQRRGITLRASPGGLSRRRAGASHSAGFVLFGGGTTDVQCARRPVPGQECQP